ncbi:MAG: chloride channel protein, partial [Lacunisphaera sp.]
FIRTLVFAEDIFPKIKNPYLRHSTGMLMVGVLIYALMHYQGHYFVEGVGYATIQAILQDNLTGIALLLGLFAAKLFATSVSLGSGSSGGIFSPSLFMGATLGAAFGGFVNLVYPMHGVDPVTCAIIGMAAMVGGGTGAAMTAVTMIFEMTRDYDIVTPMIIAVALAVGVRRVLSPETIYTLKLVARRHFIPKALHANVFLVRSASDVMDRDIHVLPSTMHFDDFLKEPEPDGKFRHVVVTDGERITGVLRVNPALRHGLMGADTGVTLGEVALKTFTLASEDEVMFNVIERLWRSQAVMVVVVKSNQPNPHSSDICGVIAKESVADLVAESLRPYAEADPTAS